jgi:Flp pilus assembly protein TadD
MARPGPKATASPALAQLRQVVQRAIQAGDHVRIAAALEQAVRLAPGNGALFHDLGMAYLALGRVPDALAALRRADGLRPGNGATSYGMGLALEQTGDDAAALASYRRAASLAPKLAEAHTHVGNILTARGDYAGAAAAYQKAYAAAPATTQGLLCRAKGLVVQERREEAGQRLRELAARAPDDAEVHLVLGLFLAEEGRFDEAAVHFERSIAIAPRQATSYAGLATSKKLGEEDRPLLARIVARIDAGDLPDRHRMTLHFAAGKALDDLKDPGAAIVQFDAANTVRKRLAPFVRADFAARVDRLAARFTRAFFDENAPLGTDDETPVLVLGMPRSGTTLIERMISAHPSVAGGGELPYWNEHARSLVDAGDDALRAAAPGLRRDYLALLRVIGPGALRVTDKMPFNFLWLGLVHALFPRARFVHCRRNPLDTCLSMYQTQFAANWGFASDRGDLAFYYRQYLRLMDHWRAVVPADRLLDVDYEEATAAPEDTARRLVEFCGLPWDEACLRPDRNADSVKTASRWQARQPVYRTSVERWRRYEPWLGELRELLPG